MQPKANFGAVLFLTMRTEDATTSTVPAAQCQKDSNKKKKLQKDLLSGMEPFSSYKLAKRSRLPNTRRKSKKANNQTPLQIDVLHFTLVLPSISLVAANVLILE